MARDLIFRKKIIISDMKYCRAISFLGQEISFTARNIVERSNFYNEIYHLPDEILGRDLIFTTKNIIYGTNYWRAISFYYGKYRLQHEILSSDLILQRKISFLRRKILACGLTFRTKDIIYGTSDLIFRTKYIICGTKYWRAVSFL